MSFGNYSRRRYPTGFYLDCLASLATGLRDRWSIFWVSLSTFPGADQAALLDHHRELARRVSDKYENINAYIGCRTAEGNGVLHVLWFFRPRSDGGLLFLPGKELTALWTDINGGLNSRFLRVGGQGNDDIKLARYIAGQKQFIRSFKSRGFHGQLGTVFRAA
jgi:hypothetical protein